MRNTLLLFMSYPVYGILLQQTKWTKIIISENLSSHPHLGLHPEERAVYVAMLSQFPDQSGSED